VRDDNRQVLSYNEMLAAERGYGFVNIVDHNSGASSDTLASEDDLFRDRAATSDSISPEQAVVHMMKCMMGTGMLSIPLAFKYSGLALGMISLILICLICIYCARQLVIASHYMCLRKGQVKMDYANVMRTAVELGPHWMRKYGYLAKQIVNFNMFVAQFGFCCVYIVFMADNVKQFFDETSKIHMSKAIWIALIMIPEAGLCTIRHLKALAPLAFMANIVYMVAVVIVLGYLFTDHLPSYTLPAFPRNWGNLPLFFGTVIFSFEGIAVVLPIENQMDAPFHFISPTGVLNTSFFLVLIIYSFVGFFGYLKFGDAIKDTITLNLPQTAFYGMIKVMFVGCIMVSYPLQFYVPMERVEKWITRKIRADRQNFLIYVVRYCAVILTCLMAELVPHLALFISLLGAFVSTALALIFPPLIELLCYYARGRLNWKVWTINIFILLFALFGCITGTYASMIEIIAAFGTE
uniref:Amino acid transporter transmembrane domain-containing protein n=1 Tax=Parascaris univalens TaxID=6257 RepID=A0A915C683_PARUN